MGTLFTVVMVLVLALASSVSEKLPVKVIKVTVRGFESDPRSPVIIPGDSYIVTVQTEPSAACRFEIRFKGGPWFSPETRRANAEGLVSRQFNSDRTTGVGTWPLIVTCELGDRKGLDEILLYFR